MFRLKLIRSKELFKQAAESLNSQRIEQTLLKKRTLFDDQDLMIIEMPPKPKSPVYDPIVFMPTRNPSM